MVSLYFKLKLRTHTKNGLWSNITVTCQLPIQPIKIDTSNKRQLTLRIRTIFFIYVLCTYYQLPVPILFHNLFSAPRWQHNNLLLSVCYCVFFNKRKKLKSYHLFIKSMYSSETTVNMHSKNEIYQSSS